MSRPVFLLKNLTLLVCALFISSAHAGWIKDFCERYLVAEDPYQYEQTPSSWLIGYYGHLCIKARWTKDPDTVKALELVEKDLLQRVRLGSRDSDKISAALFWCREGGSVER